MKKIFKYFLEGLILIIPTGITIFIVYWVGSILDNLAGSILRIFGLSLYPGVGILLTVTLIIFIGLISRNWLSKKIFDVINRIFIRVPFVKVIYTTVRDILDSLTGNKEAFSKLALVNLPGSDIKLLGFITNENLENFQLDGYVAVYLMQSMQWAGNLVLIPKEMVTVLDIPVEEAMKFIASAGLVSSDKSAK